MSDLRLDDRASPPALRADDRPSIAVAAGSAVVWPHGGRENRVAGATVGDPGQADRLAWLVLAILGCVCLATFRDYGLGWDDYTHWQYGELLYSYFASGFVDRRAFGFVNLYYYGGGFDLAATALAKLLPLDPFELRRLLGGCVGLLGLAMVWRTARRIGGPTAGLFALCLLAVCPLYYGQMFMNAKDAPFAVAVAGVLYGLVRAIESYPRPSAGTIAIIGLGLGLAVGTRIAGLIVGGYALVAIAVVVIAERHALGTAAWHRLWRFLGALMLGLPLAYFAMAVVWPWGVLQPTNPITALTYYATFWEVPWRELFDGVPVLVTQMPRTYVLTLLAVRMPELFLLLGLGGMLWATRTVCSPQAPALHRGQIALIATAVLLPIAMSVITRPPMYNDLRHFMFVTPALAILGGLAGARLWTGVSRDRPRLRGPLAGVLMLGAALPAVDFVRLHPFAYTYFNEWAGGVRGGERRFLLDYWGMSFEPAALELNAFVERRGEEEFPAGKPIKVAVCGPHAAAAVALGPRFETTYDSRAADFALLLGEFYCATPTAPVVAEIVRDGVVYARVLDVRDRPFPSVFKDGK